VSTVSAKYFDGSTPQACPVEISQLETGVMLLSFADGSKKNYKLSELIIPSQVGRVASVVSLPDGGSIQFPNTDEALEVLRKLRPNKTDWLHILEKKWQLVLISLVGAVISAFVVFTWGVPVVARIAQPFISHELKEVIGNHVITLLDSQFLKPSNLSEDVVVKQLELIESLFKSDYVDYQLLVRSTDPPMANALAILPRTIILTDQLLEELTSEEIFAVVAHEIGHLVYDHGTQKLLQSSLLTTAGVSIFGMSLMSPDILQILAFALIFSDYSRTHEREADAFAVSLIKSHERVSADHLVSALQKITKCETEECLNREPSLLERYGTTHPAIKERVDLIRGESEIR